VNQIVNLSIGNGKEKETLCCGNGKVQMHVQVHYYKCMYHVMVFSTFLIFSPVQVLFKDGAFQWKRLENLIVLAKENVSKMSSNPALKKNSS